MLGRHRAPFLAILLLAALVTSVHAEAPGFLFAFGSAGSGAGQFSQPVGVALDASGNVYVTDSYNHRIEVFAPDGDYRSQWGSYGAGAGQLSYPSRIAIGPDGLAYVLDSGNTRVEVFTTSGDYVREWNGTNGSQPVLRSPQGLAIGPDGTVYVAGLFGEIRRFTPEGVNLEYFGTNGSGTWSCQGVAAAPDGTVCGSYLDDNQSGYMVFFDAVTRGVTADYGSGPGAAFGTIYDAMGNLYMVGGGQLMPPFMPPVYYIAALSPARTQLFKLTTAGGSAAGDFRACHGVAVTAAGRLYVTDTSNNRVEVFDAAATPTRSTSWGALKATYR